jgi:hypothetical protein
VSDFSSSSVCQSLTLALLCSNYPSNTAFVSNRDTAGDYWTGVVDPAQARLAQAGDRPPSTLTSQLLTQTTTFFSVCC